MFDTPPMFNAGWFLAPWRAWAAKFKPPASSLSSPFQSHLKSFASHLLYTKDVV
jgi:hypothetical protein